MRDSIVSKKPISSIVVLAYCLVASILYNFIVFDAEAAGAGAPDFEFIPRMGSELGKCFEWRPLPTVPTIDLCGPDHPKPGCPIVRSKDQGAFSTIPIYVVYNKEGMTEEQEKIVGTSFLIQDGSNLILMTNPHVIKTPPDEVDGKKLTNHTFEILLHCIDTREIDSNKRLVVLAIRAKVEDFQKQFFMKSASPLLELAALDFQTLVAKTRVACPFLEPFILPVSISSFSNLREGGYFDEIRMFGYPKGHINETFNLPLARTGKTSTYVRAKHPNPEISQKLKDGSVRKVTAYVDFMIDAACMPGSSGSPVWLLREVNVEAVTDVRVKASLDVRKISIGSEDVVASVDDNLSCDVDLDHESIVARSLTKPKFLGVLFGGPYLDKNSKKGEQAVPIHLGWVIHAQTVKKFIDNWKRRTPDLMAESFEYISKYNLP